MSAKSKKRLCKLENKLLRLDKLQIKDVICSICQSILIEPVTLPCFHDFCQSCFKGTIENNALSCPLCRLRIGSWIRTATKRNNLVNAKLWDFLSAKFPQEIETKLKGEDIDVPEEKPLLRLSVPGEIRSEYEAELQRLRAERLRQEQQHIEQTELLIKKLQKEEQEAQRKYIERLKQDELLAKKIQQQESKSSTPSKRKKGSLQHTPAKRKVPNKIDSYLAKLPDAVPKETAEILKDSPLLTDDVSVESTPKGSTQPSEGSPEVVPSYTSLIKSYFNKKLKTTTNVWNKENGETESKGEMEEEKISPTAPKINNTIEEEKKIEVVKSLVVSLPLPNVSVLQQMTNAQKKVTDSDSVDSMRQELCFFKPIEKVSSSSANKVIPVKVPCVRTSEQLSTTIAPPVTPPRLPSRTEFVHSLCTLRQISLSNNRRSAFVVPYNFFKDEKVDNTKINVENNKSSQSANSTLETCPRRRTRSMGSIAKDENETTPKKVKLDRKAHSERKAPLRRGNKSSGKKIKSPPLTSKTLNNNKVSLAVKNLSSPLNNCDVKQILQEQLRIEKMIEQEKKDLELARQVDAELNARRQLRRAPTKRQVTLNYALRPAKKMKA